MADIHVLFGRRWRLGQDTKPAERILALEYTQKIIRDRRTAHAMETVAACDDVAIDLLHRAFMPIADARPADLKVLQTDILGLEHDPPANAKSRGDQVLHHQV